MQTQFKDISIKRYALNKVKKLVYVSMGFCFILSFLYSSYISIYNKQKELNHLAELIGKTSGKTILIGGDYLPKNWANGLVQTSDVSNVWIQSGNVIIAEAHSTSRKFTLAEIKDNNFILEDWTLSLVGNRDVFYNGQHIAKLFVLSPIDLFSLFSLSLFSSLLVSLFFAVFLIFIRKMAEDISNPLYDFSNYIESKIKDDALLEDKENKEWKFKEINLINKMIIEYFIKAKESERLTLKAVSGAQLSKIFREAKHDITASLGLGESQLSRINGHDNIASSIKAVFNRIYDIIENIPNTALLTFEEIDEVLDHSHKCTSTEKQEKIRSPRTILLLSHVKTIVNEMKYSKFAHSKNINFVFEYDKKELNTYISVEPTQFHRSLINILKNSIEGIATDGEIKIKIFSQGDFVNIVIIDNGIGISKENLNKIGKSGFTYGKKNGTGLGISTTIEAVKKWSGQVEIKSKLDYGTAVNIKLPVSENEYLYPGDLTLTKGMSLISIDDDPSIHSILDQKFKTLIEKKDLKEIIHIDNSDDLSKVVHSMENQEKDFIVLVDQNIRGEDEKGTEIIKRLNIESNSIILSSNAHFEELYTSCKALDVPILAKTLLPELPINIIQ